MADKHDHTGARIQILRETFGQVSPEQGTVLVGILFENRFVLTVPIWNPASDCGEAKPVILVPLDPQSAAILVADAFGLDCDDLFHRFQHDWGALKDSTTTDHMRSRIGGHEAVERLEECSPLG